ncbi:MAG: hypothetical protein FWH21_07295 [Kiritimatiellaeota bacterium]|nr:hypothetical protein [Kiritimatiellota bacterium]
MKIIQPLMTIMLCGCAFIAQARKTDILKPIFQEQELELQRIMEVAASGGLKYDAVIETVARTNKMRQEYFIKVPTVRIPEDVREKVVKYNQRFARWHFAMYLDEPKYSFYAAILILGRGTGTSLPESIINHDKELWWNQDLSKKKELFLTMSICSDFQPGKRETVPLEGYYGSVLFESMPPNHIEHIFAERIYKPRTDSSFLIMNETSPILPYGYWPGTGDKTGTSYAKSFDAFLKDGDKDVLKEIALVQPCVEHWLYLTLFGEEDKRLLALEGLLAWSRINAPVENPFLSALAMGLFTVNGYSFNDETGVYTMKERGKMLMDFIVEFPIPENATRLKAVMDGGNKDEIQAMMKKHSTEEKWEALLQNPVHPEFAKYPQD